MRRLSLGFAVAVFAMAGVGASAGRAGVVCRSNAIAGFEVEARAAHVALAAATSDSQGIEVFVAHTPFGYYYESNYVAPGARYPAKIYTAAPLTLRALVENLLFTSRAAADAGRARTDAVAGQVVVYLDAALYDAREPTGLDDATVVRRVTPALPVVASAAP